jgi:flagellar biosynthesis protein FliR
MEHTFFFSMAEVVRFAIVLLRVAGLMVFAPFFSSRSIPAQVRVVLALVVTFSLVSSLNLAQIPAEFGLSQVVWAAVGEALFGMVLGLAATFIFAGMQMAGHLIGLQLGFSLINLIDPQSEVETTVVEFLENYIGLMFFLLLNGHHWFLTAVSESFTYLPIQGVHVNGSVVHEVVRLSAQVFTSGLQIAGPVIAASVIADVVLGVIGRAAPQIHILVVGMPLKTLVGLTFLSLSFYFLPRFFDQAYTQLYRNLSSLLHAMV